MASSLSHFINNLAEGIRKIKCKNEQNNIKYETCGIKYTHCNFFLEYTRFKNDSTGYKSLRSNKISVASNLKVKLDLLTYIDILSMVRKCVQAGICPAIYKCVKANKKYIKKP